MIPSTKLEMKTGSIPLEPDPIDWLTTKRRENFKDIFGTSETFLLQAGLWRATIGYWVRWQASLEADWDPADENKELNILMNEWKKKNESEIQTIKDDTLKAKLRVKPAIERWSKQNWSHRVDSLFLIHKSQLDRASCRLLRIENKHMANEVYHRIKARETTFEAAAYEYGEGPEKYRGGVIPEQSLANMPFGLAELLIRLKPGRLSKPLRLGDGFCLVELISFKSSTLDESTTTKLLAEQMRLWIDSVVDVLESELLCKQNQSKEKTP